MGQPHLPCALEQGLDTSLTTFATRSNPLSLTASTANDEAVLRAVVVRLLSGGSRVTEDARWLVSILPADLLGFFRAEASAAIRGKAGDPVKARKILYALGDTARNIFGDTYAEVKQDYDRASKDAARARQPQTS
jgi:hypothetical protein